MTSDNMTDKKEPTMSEEEDKYLLENWGHLIKDYGVNPLTIPDIVQLSKFVDKLIQASAVKARAEERERVFSDFASWTNWGYQCITCGKFVLNKLEQVEMPEDDDLSISDDDLCGCE